LEDRPSEAKILWNFMLLEHFSGSIEEALAYGERSVALARELGLREQLAYSLNDISRPFLQSNQLERGIAALNEARDLWRALDNRPMLADNLNTLAMTLFNLGDYETALAHAAEAYQIGQSTNNSWTQAHSLMIRAFIRSDRGEVEESIKCMREGLQQAQQVGFLLAVTSMKNSLVLTYANMGDVKRALECVSEFNPSDGQKEVWQSSWHGVLAQLYLMQGNLEPARAEVQESYRTLAHAAPNPFLMGSGQLADAELAVVKKDYGRAIDVSDALLHKLGERGVRSFRLYVVYIKARALCGLGRIDEAQQDLEKARSEAVRVGMKRNLWRILALLGEIETRRGHAERAKEYHAQACEVLDFITAHTPAEYRSSFLTLPEVRAIYERAGTPAAPENPL
jgi:tetratricopeptide (TPR) repeat protein